MSRKEKCEARVNMRVLPSQLEQVKKISEKKGVPYQTLIRMWIEEGIWREKEFENSFRQMLDNSHDV